MLPPIWVRRPAELPGGNTNPLGNGLLKYVTGVTPFTEEANVVVESKPM
jgi:hypothetical protein